MGNIEEQFYKTFEIEKQRRLWTPKEGFKNYYPQITDRILLELICILNECYNGSIQIFAKSAESLRNGVLRQAIDSFPYALDKEKFKQQVQALFKG